MVKMIGLLLTGVLLTTLLPAQDTLPHFSAIARGPGKILISWHNKYPVVTQISIQRSTDSLKNFATLLTVPDPTLPANGITDNKAPHPNFYYRLFIVLDNGKYLFTPSHRPGATNEGVVSTEGKASAAQNEKAEEEDFTLAKMAGTRILYVDPADKEKARVKSPTAIHTMPSVELSNTVFVRKGDSLIGQLHRHQPYTGLPRFIAEKNKRYAVVRRRRYTPDQALYSKGRIQSFPICLYGKAREHSRLSAGRGPKTLCRKIL
ncbi:hypothetical protein ACQ86N_09860 [Puia sp. P3]|uniref:hypothetical protein n=1 Tax=Puia sp. P3 TaxID=3423952 RepID=UPI003D6658FF